MSAEPEERPSIDLAHFPRGMTVDLFVALGGLVEAALSGCGELMLTPPASGRYGDNSSGLTLHTGLTRTQVAAALRDAAAQLDPARAAEAAAEQPAERDGGDMTIEEQVAEDDGTVTFATRTPDETAQAFARNVFAHFEAAFAEHDPPNYLSIPARHPETGMQWEVSLTRTYGKTPGEVAKRLKAAVEWIASHEPTAGGKRTRVTQAAIFERCRSVLADVDHRPRITSGRAS